MCSGVIITFRQLRDAKRPSYFVQEMLWPSYSQIAQKHVKRCADQAVVQNCLVRCFNKPVVKEIHNTWSRNGRSVSSLLRSQAILCSSGNLKRNVEC